MKAGGSKPTPKQVDGSMSDWVGESTWIGGMSNYSRGEFIYQDYVYDDYGADARVNAEAGSGRVGWFGLLPPVGSYRYPTDIARYGNNCADLVQLRMASDSRNIYILALLNTLLVPDSTVVGIAFGPDVGTSSPAKCAGHTWPFQAGITTPGTDHVLTLWGTGGAWDTTDLMSVDGRVAVSVEENVIEASIPIGLLGTLKFWCYAATGLWDPQARTWLEVKERRNGKYPGGARSGDPRVFNLAFRAGEGGTWFDERQAFILRCGEAFQRTGSAVGDIHLAAQFIDLDHHVDTPVKPPTGYYQRVYPSSLSLGEGVSENGVMARGATGAKLAYHMLGHYQPYTVYVPREYDGLVLWLHGGFGNHTSVISERSMQSELGDIGKLLIVSPLGRGLVGGWVDHSYLDVVDVLEDVMKRYPVDPDRIYVSGWSMGGQGASRFLTTRPDLFAASYQWVPGEIRPPKDSIAEVESNPGCTVDLYENVRHVPVLFVVGQKDTTGNTEFALTKAERMKSMGYMYRLCTHPLYGHIDVYRSGDYSREREWLEDKRVVRNPAHVTYKTCEAWWRPDVSPKLVFDHAYWVFSMRVRDTTKGLNSFGKVDAVSHALGGSEPGLKRFHFALPGPPSCYEIEGQDYVWPGQAIERYNGFSATFENLKEIVFDARGMGLDLLQPLRFETTSDGIVRLRLSGVWPEVQVYLDGEEFSHWAHKESWLEFEIPAGSHGFKAAIGR